MLYMLLREITGWLSRQGLYGYFRVLDQMHFRVLAAACLAFAAVLVLGRPTIRWLRRKRIGDTGLSDAELLRRQATSKANTPTMGGVLIVGSAAVVTLLLADLTNFYVKLGLVVMVWLAVVGGFDDWLKLTAATRASRSRQGLRAWEKLVFQLGLGVLVGYFVHQHGDSDSARDAAHVLNLPFQKTYDGPELAEGLVYLGVGVFVVWSALFMTGMSNAVNITDGMDGLAAGTTVAVSIGLVLLALVAGTQSQAQYLLVPFVPTSGELAVLGAAVAGACLGFMWWNCAPAQVFMGDTGSLALGGTLAYVALVVRQEFVLLLMSGVFLAEIASVVMQVAYFKMSGGRRIFRCAPYHHHLHLLGWTESQVVARAWIVTVLLVLVGLATLKVR